jgi:hypothetical protein
VEIGAGGGWNLAGLPKSWRRIGYDADETYLDAGRRLFEVDLRNGFLGEARKDIGDADAVLLSHVVEHLSDPVAALRDLASALPAQSLMLIEVPGVFRIHSTARDPMVYMQNAHLYTFCAQTLARTCESAGLEVLSVDEWCRLVARRAEGGRTPVRAPDPHLAARVLAYLRRCERAHRFTERVRSVPLIGGNAGRVAAKAWGLAMELSASKPGRSR